MKKNTSGALLASFLLHGLLVGVAFLMVLFVPEKNVSPDVFELVSVPHQIFTQEEAAEIAFEPIPVEPLPEPEPIPEPERIAEPVPEPEPEKISYEQFIREQGKPKVQQPRKVRPKPIKVPRINTSQILSNLREIMVDTNQLSRMSQSEISALEAYFARLKQALKGAWSKPTGLSDRLQCTVEFGISPSGIISGARIVSSSGNTDFDASVLAAFKAVRNFGSTPDGRGYPSRVTFRMTD